MGPSRGRHLCRGWPVRSHGGTFSTDRSGVAGCSACRGRLLPRRRCGRSGDVRQLALRTLAACGPLGPSVTSYSTF